MKSEKGTRLPARFKKDTLSELDGRVRAVRELKERWRQLASDLGGESALSYQRRSLMWRFVCLESWIEDQERRMIQGQTVDESKWLTALNGFVGLLSRIGLERRARPVSPIERLRLQATPAPDPGEQVIVPSGPNAAGEPPPEETLIEVIP